MARVRLASGQTINFQGNPTQDDIEDAVSQLSTPSATPGQRLTVAPQTAEQVVSSKGVLEQLKSLKPRAEQIPELAGTTIGAVAGGIPGAILGGAAGEAGRQLLGRTGILKTETPETPSRAASEILGGGLRGGLAEIVGRTIAFPFTRKAGVTPQAAQLTRLAQKEGITPALSARTQSKAIERLEAATERSLFTGEKVRIGKLKALSDFETFAGRFNVKTAPQKPESLGNFVTAKLGVFKANFRQTKEQLYDAFMPQVKDVKPQISETINTLESIVARRSGVAEPAGLGQFKKWLNTIKGKEGIPSLVIPGKEGSIRTFRDLRAFKSNVGARGKFGDPGATGLEADFKELFAAISKDMDSTIKGVSGDFGQQLDNADAFFAKGINQLKSDLFEKLSTTPQDQLDTVLIRKDSPELIAAAKELIGEEGFKNIRRQWIEKTLRTSRKEPTLAFGKERLVDPDTFVKKIQALGTTRNALFEGAELKAFNEVFDIARLLAQTKKVGVNLGVFSALADQVLGGIVSPAITTETGKRFLSTGFPRTAVGVTRAVSPLTQLGLQGENR